MSFVTPLSDRLKRLEGYGIIEKQPYQKNPVRYEYCMTKRGKSLRPLIKAMMRWGREHIQGARQGEDYDDM